jgi:hypothetical protein
MVVMKNLVKFTALIIVLGFMFSCNKEDIRPNEKEEVCTCTQGKSGATSGSTCSDGITEPPITDPNNDEDESKVIRKSLKV